MRYVSNNLLNMKHIKLSLVYFLFLIFTCKLSSAQQTAIYTDTEKSYKQGLELFDKEKYAAAQSEFDKIIADKLINSYQVLANANYYAALCGMQLFNTGAEFKMEDFVAHFPESPKVKTAAFQLGKYYSKQKRYKDAIEWFGKTDVFFLSNDETAEYYFKLGYAYFNTNNLNSAEKAFFQAKSVNSKYTPAANYYYAHIQYQNQKYEPALKSFFKLKSSDIFAPIVPYYICQIYYIQEKYDSLIAYAMPLLAKSNPQNTIEMEHLIGDSYYKKADYTNAIPYLEGYVKKATGITRIDYYQIGFAFYKTKGYESAIANLEKCSDIADSLSQSALYILGDCFVKTDKKNNARNAFLLASKSDFDLTIKEDALFNYAKLSSEMAFQAPAINAFQEYVKKYPNSTKLDEANTILAELYYATKNYQDALTTLDNIRNKNERIKRVYQKIAYYRGVELFNNTLYADAENLFDKAISYNFDQKITALAIYWNAEIAYKQGAYENAIKRYNAFMESPSANTTSLYNTANYNLGYCYLKLENYTNSLICFGRYIKDKVNTDNNRYNDALVRIGDNYFVLKDYVNSIIFYDLAIQSKASSSDYALFQKGTIQGIQGQFNEKVSTLDILLSKYPKSAYFDDAMYEQAKTDVTLGENLQALNLFNDIVNKYQQSSYIKKSLLGMALVFYNERRDEKALDIYKQIVANYPSTLEAKEALVGIKNIYVSNGDANTYLKYISQVSFANISISAQDSITYEAAELRYMKEDCDNAVNDFNNYLANFSNAYFAINANFYKSECLYKSQQYTEALPGYEFVISKPRSNFTEKALLKSANIYYILKQYDKSLDSYTKLEQTAEYKSNIKDAQIGIMRSASFLNKNDIAGKYAKRVMSAEKISEGMTNEAHLVYAKSMLAQDSVEIALKEFTLLSKFINSDIGAEAKYNIAYIFFKKGKNKETEKTVFELVNQASSDYWIAKAYILLADNYVALKDLFQAKATLKSIIENYDGNDLKGIAQQKLDEITVKENEQLLIENKEKEKLIPAPNEITPSDSLNTNK
jgi:TolA-binding protein